MKVLNIGGKEYKMEFTFEAAECRDIVQKMFDVMSGAFMFKRIKDGEDSRMGMIDSTTALVAEIPHICKSAFYAGLLEHKDKQGNFTEKEAAELMKLYMKENKISYSAMHEFVKECMEEDGFFDLSGITEMLEKMNESTEEQKQLSMEPQDHKKKSTSTK